MVASTRLFAAIPDVGSTPEGMRAALAAVKANVELLTQQNPRAKSAAAVTWQDLLDLGLIEANQIPT